MNTQLIRPMFWSKKCHNSKQFNFASVQSFVNTQLVFGLNRIKCKTVLFQTIQFSIFRQFSYI